jgi:hypothetical protein
MMSKKNAKPDRREFPILRQAGAILFDKLVRRYKESLGFILVGANLPK